MITFQKMLACESLQGLGKTVQLCAYLGCMASSRKCRSILVISPATMLQHWLKELAKIYHKTKADQTEEVKQICGSEFDFIDKGYYKVKGKSAEVRLYEPKRKK